MVRSLKKSPFVAYHLLKKIDKMNKANKKETITTGQDLQRFYQI